MDNKEFKEKVEELFKEFEIDFDGFTDENYLLPDYKLNDVCVMRINDHSSFIGEYCYRITNRNNKDHHESSPVATLELLLDELVIFKELHLPKYL